jgi:ABC-type antimicrobial peptide transport system permease subunit
VALGSDPWRVFKLILSEGLMLLGAGLALGALGAFSIRSALESQLYGVSAMDPLVVTTVAAVLALISLGACAVPARRAARIDPLIALN